MVIHWLIFPYPSGLLHWHCGNLTIAPVPAKQPWWIWINTSCEFIMNDCITTTKQSTTQLCAYFLGYTVLRNYRMSFLPGKCGQWFLLLKYASMYKMQLYVFVVGFYYSYRRTGLYETSGKVYNLLTPVCHVKSSGLMILVFQKRTLQLLSSSAEISLLLNLTSVIQITPRGRIPNSAYVHLMWYHCYIHNMYFSVLWEMQYVFLIVCYYSKIYVIHIERTTFSFYHW